MAANSQIDPRLDPLLGTRAVQPNWALQMGGGMPMQNPWATAAPQDVALANQTAQTAQADQMAAAAQRAAAGGIQAQKDDEGVDAVMSQHYEVPTQKAKIDRQFKTADAIRKLGSSLNTGSVNGGAPNWMGAIANVAGAYFGKKQQDEADAAAAALGTKEAGLAGLDFRNRPTSYF